MKAKKTIYITILVALTTLLFSSCVEDDYRWERTSLVYTSRSSNTVPITDRYGVVKIDLRMNIRDLPHTSDRIHAIRMISSYFSVYSEAFLTSDHISLYIRSNRGLEYGGKLYPIKNGREHIIEAASDPNFGMFVDDILYDLEYYGVVDLQIDVDTRIGEHGIPVEFEFVSDVDLEVWR